MEEIDRILFVSLNYCRIDHCFIVLNDQNFVESFYANSDEEAKANFRSKYGK